MFVSKDSQAAEDETQNPYIIPTEITQIDKNKGHVVLDGHPCKIKDIWKIRNGFKGTKTYIAGSDIFTNKEHSQSFSSYGTVNVPIIKRTEYSLIGIENNFATLMDSEGVLREDLKLPTWAEKGDLADIIINAFEANQNVLVTVLEACGQEMIIGLKEDK